MTKILRKRVAKRINVGGVIWLPDDAERVATDILCLVYKEVEGIKNPFGKSININAMNKFDGFESCRETIKKLIGGS